MRFFFVVLIFLFWGCVKNEEISFPTENKTLQTDFDFTDYVAFLNFDFSFDDVQKSALYGDYKKIFIKKLKPKLLLNALNYGRWSRENLNFSDSTVFYPFGSADVLTVVSLFPQAKNYISFGLENIGYPFFPDSLSETEINSFFTNLFQITDEYLNLTYLRTESMKNVFRNKVFNGVLHYSVFMLNVLGEVKKIRFFVLEKNATLTFVDSFISLDSKPKGFLIDFERDNYVKQFFYVQINAKDYYLLENQEFLCFVKRLNPSITFIKAASYLLQTNDFEILKNFILKSSDVILQDDSGIAFDELKRDFDITLFGNYTKPQKLFSEYFQQSLWQYQKKHKPKEIPFIFGYNKLKNSLLLIKATKKNKQIHYPIYFVQFAIRWDKTDDFDTLKKYLPNVSFYFDEGYFKYISGGYQSVDSCKILLKKVKQLGFSDAFIVKFTKFGKQILSD